jgi:hypothetical protein
VTYIKEKSSVKMTARVTMSFFLTRCPLPRPGHSQSCL